jgi:hypothetical protein
MPEITIESIDAQETNLKVKAKKQTMTLNEKAKDSMPSKPKKFNVFKDIKYSKVKEEKEPSPGEELKQMKVELELSNFIEEQKEVLVQKSIDSREGNILTNHAYNILALPQSDPNKRKILAHRLRQNDAITKYVNEHLVFNALHRINHNARFLMHYGLEWAQTNEDYKTWATEVLRQRALTQAQEIPQQPEPVEQTTNDAATETEETKE